MRSWGIEIWIVGACLGLCACGGGDSPEQVTRQFWSAVKAGDVEGARARARGAGPDLIERTLDDASIESLLVGTSLRNESAALVETSLVTASPGGVELELTFHTHLVLEEEGWRVDVPATRQDLRKATLVAGMRELGEAVGQGVEEIGEAVREGTREMQEAIREALDSWDPDTKM